MFGTLPSYLYFDGAEVDIYKVLMLEYIQKYI